MNDRIKKLVEKVLRESAIYPEPISVEYDKADMFLPNVIKDTKRLCEYMLAQQVKLEDGALLAGQMRFDGSVPSNLFPRTGHRAFEEVCSAYYCKPIDNLVTFEWQHSTPNYSDVIENGLEGIIDRIHNSLKEHGEDREKREFLTACEMMCRGLIAWEEKCADECAAMAAKETDDKRRGELLKMTENLKKVPRCPAESFYEAVQSLYFCFDCLSDSIGLADRYLYKYYINDINSGVITREDAKELLQELFIRIQSWTRVGTPNFTRGGECHFAVGGYLENGEDGYNELSDLLVESLMELPTYIPQISLRWTRKTPYSVLRKLMDFERRDANKRIAFVNDEPRIKALTEIAKVPLCDAVNYTMVGCNEPALQGGIWYGGETTNLLRSVTNTIYKRTSDIVACSDFEEFYKVYREELYKDLEEMTEWGNKFNYARSKDENVLSSLFLKGCIENGVTVTRGGSIGIAGLDVMGLTNVIDSLTIIKQFVYDEKKVSMQELFDALDNNWQGSEELHTLIMRKGKFFGNGYEISDEMARRISTDIYNFFNGKVNIFGKRFLVGNLAGYHQHYAWFGTLTRATPDGRRDGEQLSLGIGQSGGRDREGLTALLSSVAQFDPTGIFCGPSVTNINIDSQMLYNDENFEKTVKTIETYFKMGGLHVQLNSVRREDLIEAQKTPDKYKTLRVRVSGFSDYFVNLNEDLQENIIERTNIGR